jgi:hypothetical protein
MAFHGKLGRGYMRLYREMKREEAQAMQAATPHERKKQHRKALESLGECPDCGEKSS